VSPESARRGEFAQPVADHVLGDVDRNVAPAVVHSDGVSDHLRENGAGPAPGADDLLFALLVHGFHFFQNLGVDERPLLQ
jgi:hypothetical protein